MRASPFRSRLLGTATILVSAALCFGAGWGQRKDEEPKSQVQPLPPEPPAALAAPTRELDFHISPCLRSGGLLAQIRQSLNDLIRDTHGETIVKLRAFVAGTGDARRVQAEVGSLFRAHKLPLPVLTILQVGSLDDPAEQVVIEAVVDTHRTVNPNGLAFFYGQNGRTYEEALQRLKSSTDALGIAAENVLSTTCFAAGVPSFEEADRAVHALFPKTGVNVMQPVRDPRDQSSHCEAIAQLTAAPKEPIVHADVNATLVNTPELVFTGLQLSFGSYLVDAQEAFERLERTAHSIDSDETPVQINGFSLNTQAASALRKKNSLSPGVFSVETIEGLSSIDATGGIEAVLASPRSDSR